MDEEFRILYVDRPDDAVWEVVGGGIHDYNTQHAGGSHGKGLCFVLYGPGQQVVGGVVGETHWDWFFTHLLFVKEELRGRGYGHQLLTLAEEEARQRGAKNAYLDTFSFQAPGFYKKHGYEVFGVLGDFPVGHQRYFLKKRL
jgi:GNAT superfamily N-acetyltransferase